MTLPRELPRDNLRVSKLIGFLISKERTREVGREIEVNSSSLPNSFMHYRFASESYASELQFDGLFFSFSSSFLIIIFFFSIYFFFIFFFRFLVIFNPPFVVNFGPFGNYEGRVLSVRSKSSNSPNQNLPTAITTIIPFAYSYFLSLSFSLFTLRKTLRFASTQRHRTRLLSL